MNLDDYIKNLPPEVLEKARDCKNLDEFLALASEKGVPLPGDIMERVAGGRKGNAKNCGGPKCPKCGGKSFTEVKEEYLGYMVRYLLKCKKCGNEFWYNQWC